MRPEHYAEWLAIARRYARAPHEAEDLLHEALIAAAQAGRTDLDADADRRWLRGVLRNRAAFDARSASRRRQREAASAMEPVTAPPGDPVLEAWPGTALAALPRSSRHVLALALHGLGRREITAVLGLSDAAFRQRLVALRKALGKMPPAFQDELRAWGAARARARGARSVSGQGNQALDGAAPATPGLGTRDPDGHLLVLATKT